MILQNKKKYAAIIASIIILDQLTKFIIVSIFDRDPYKAVHVIKSFFSIRYVENSGAVWGIFSESPHSIMPLIITIFAISAFLLVGYFFHKLQYTCVLELTSLSFIMGGAVGNIIDRLSQGYVVDFIDFFVKNYHWPTFNVADSFISVGVGLLIIAIWRGKCTQF